MKHVLLLFALITAVSAFGQTVDARPSGKLIRAEKMTPEELQKLDDVEMVVTKAQAALAETKRQIAIAHKMLSASANYMEYSYTDWVEFDGDWLLQRHRFSTLISPVIIGDTQ